MRADEIADRVVVTDTGCWEWQLYRDRANYGRVTHHGKPGSHAHRVAYELLVGPIPDGLHLDHLCFNPPCVNPDHLEPVTPGENTRRVRTGAAATHCRHGHEFTEANTYIKPDGCRTCRACQRAAVSRYKRSHSA